MSHVPVPVLRRMQDEPLAVPDADRRHLAGCARCQDARRAAEADAAFAARLLGPPPADPDTSAEWQKLIARLRTPAPVPAGSRRLARAAPRVGCPGGWPPPSVPAPRSRPGCCSSGPPRRPR
jgi:hypothetical protein